MTATTGRTRRDPQGAFAGQGAVRQAGGHLPIYICNTCERSVVWVESKKTGRKYLANVRRGHMDQRYYIGADIHDCERIMADRAAQEREQEANRHALYLLHLMDRHEQGEHHQPTSFCLFCERGVDPAVRTQVRDEALS